MDAAMTERDPFERELGRAMTPRPVPVDLQRRIANIPLDHPRPRGARPGSSWRRWLGAFSMPWTASLAGAAASLAVGFWLGFSGLVETSDAYADGDEELVSLVFPSVPMTIGDEQ
jgi:hypothetical protein